MILMNDFKREPEELIRAQTEACERVFRSGWYILGKEVDHFERGWAAACGVDHCVGVGNGMDAIEIGLRALGIGPGDEVITTPMTAFATVLAVIRSGATPVLADIDAETALLDPASVERCVSPRTKAILLVHLYGQVSRMDEWQALCASRGLHLLEDCAQSHLAAWDGACAGSFGQWGAYSFYPTKNLGAIGDGGAIVTRSRDLADKFRKLRNYGQSVRYHHPVIGLNSRLDEIHAAILSARLVHLRSTTDSRREIAEQYHRTVVNPRITLLRRPHDPQNHVYHLFVLLCKERDKLAAHMKACGIETLIHYPIPVHRQEPCLAIKRDPNGLPNAERHAQVCLSIPCHPYLGEDEQNRIVEAMNGFGGR